MRRSLISGARKLWRSCWRRCRKVQRSLFRKVPSSWTPDILGRSTIRRGSRVAAHGARSRRAIRAPNNSLPFKISRNVQPASKKITGYDKRCLLLTRVSISLKYRQHWAKRYDVTKAIERGRIQVRGAASVEK